MILPRGVRLRPNRLMPSADAAVKDAARRFAMPRESASLTAASLRTA